MKTNLVAMEKQVLSELIRRARAVGELRRIGLPMQHIAEIRGLERRALERAQKGEGKDSASTLFTLVQAWRLTLQDLLGDRWNRCALGAIQRPKGWKTGQDAAQEIHRVCRAAIMARRYDLAPGRTRDYYDDTEAWGANSTYLAAVVCLAPVVFELVDKGGWKCPRS